MQGFVVRTFPETSPSPSPSRAQKKNQSLCSCGHHPGATDLFVFPSRRNCRQNKFLVILFTLVTVSGSSGPLLLSAQSPTHFLFNSFSFDATHRIFCGPLLFCTHIFMSISCNGNGGVARDQLKRMYGVTRYFSPRMV